MYPDWDDAFKRFESFESISDLFPDSFSDPFYGYACRWRQHVWYERVIKSFTRASILKQAFVVFY